MAYSRTSAIEKIAAVTVGEKVLRLGSENCLVAYHVVRFHALHTSVELRITKGTALACSTTSDTFEATVY